MTVISNAISKLNLQRNCVIYMCGAKNSIHSWHKYKLLQKNTTVADEDYNKNIDIEICASMPQLYNTIIARCAAAWRKN